MENIKKSYYFFIHIWKHENEKKWVRLSSRTEIDKWIFLHNGMEQKIFIMSFLLLI